MHGLSRLLAWRYLFSNRLRFTRLLTGVALFGIALSVWSLIVVMSVMKGFQTELNRRWIGLNAHLTIHAPTLPESIATWPEIKELHAFAEGEVIVQVPGERETISLAGKILGVDTLSPDFVKAMTLFPAVADSFSLLMGEELASSLGVHPDFNQEVTLLYPFGEIGPSGDWVPQRERMPVSHLFKTGLYQWDAYRVIVPLKKAQALLGDQAEKGWQIRLKNLSDLKSVQGKLAQQLPEGSRVESVWDQNRRILAALRLERLAMAFVLILFAIIASFSVMGLLLLFVDAKRRDIALLRAIGLTGSKTTGIFFQLGGILGGIGSVIGGGLALLTGYWLTRHPIPLSSTYYLDTLPVKMEWGSVVFMMLLGIGVSLFAAGYPARLASRFEILPMLREE